MSEQQQGRLVVEAPFSASELYIFDANLDRFAEGVGYFAGLVPAGLYRVGVRLGDATEDKLISVPNGGSARIGHQEWSLKYEPTAPLLISNNTKSSHQRMAELRSSSAPKYSNGDCRVFVFLFVDVETSREHENSFRVGPFVLTLYNQWGDPLAVAEWERDLETGASYATLTAELHLEGYRVRYETASGHVAEIPLWPSLNFETHLFVRWRANWVGPSFSFSMVPNGQRFNPEVVWSADKTILTELALDGLRRGRNLISDEHKITLLKGKFRNPWFGIVGTHLLLLDPKPDFNRIQIVVENLRRMVGFHPDVEALASSYGGLTSPISFPPSLRASLALLVDGKEGRSSLIKPNSLLSRVAFRSIVDGPWLTWRPDAAQEPYPGTASQEHLYGDLGLALREAAFYLGLVRADDHSAALSRSQSEGPRWHAPSLTAYENLEPRIADSYSKFLKDDSIDRKWLDSAIADIQDLIPYNTQVKNDARILEFIAYEAINRANNSRNGSDVFEYPEVTSKLLQGVLTDYLGEWRPAISSTGSPVRLLDIVGEEAASLCVISTETGTSSHAALILSAIAAASWVERPFAVGHDGDVLWIHPILRARVQGGIKTLLLNAGDSGRVTVDVPWRLAPLRVRWYNEELSCSGHSIRIVYFRTWRGYGLPPKSIPQAVQSNADHSRRFDALAGDFRLSVRRAQLAVTTDEEDAESYQAAAASLAEALLSFIDRLLS